MAARPQAPIPPTTRHRTTIRLPERLFCWLCYQSATEGRSRDAIIAEALRAYYCRTRTPNTPQID